MVRSVDGENECPLPTQSGPTSLDVAFAIADVFGVTLEAIFHRSDQSAAGDCS